MKNLLGKIQSVVLAVALAFGLTACGGSGSPSTTAATSTSKAASWADVTASSGDRKVTISWDKPGATSSTGTTPTSIYNLYFSTDPTMPATSATTNPIRSRN